MRSIVPDAVIQVLASETPIFFGECAEFRPPPYSGADLPIGYYAQSCTHNGPDCKIQPIDCQFTS
jgi:hypothetical protein